VLDGLRTVFYISGKVAEEINYKNIEKWFYKKYTEKGLF
jgi:antitoxin component YwqK of YwqJK toxin-antitoxin module